MKFLRKFNSVAALEAAIQTVTNNFIGLAYDSNNNSVVYHKRIHPPKNLTISCSDNYVTISASNATTIQYRMDEGVAWSTYSGTFEIYESVTVYARATNAYGEITGSQYCEYDDTSIPNDEIWYTTNNGSIIDITWPGGGGSGSGSGSGSGVTIVENTYEDGKGILKFSGDLTEIPSNTFNYYSQLASITIPNSVTSIGDYAFNGCSGLTNITIPNSVTSIGEDAFNSCTGLTSITIPSSVTSIGSYAFNSCTGLTSITIPSSVTSIGSYAFIGCTGLTSIVVDSNNSTFDSRNNCNAIIETSTNTLIAGCQNTVIPNTVTSIGDNAFYYCTGLTSITIPNSVTSIDGGAFYYCTGLTSINLGSGVTSINSSAFIYCTGLTSITIGSGVTIIGYNAFQSCSSLTSITCEATTPPTLDSTAFGNTNDCPIYVPVVSVDTYKAASGWRDYASRIQAIQ